MTNGRRLYSQCSSGQGEKANLIPQSINQHSATRRASPSSIHRMISSDRKLRGKPEVQVSLFSCWPLSFLVPRDDRFFTLRCFQRRCEQPVASLVAHIRHISTFTWAIDLFLPALCDSRHVREGRNNYPPAREQSAARRRAKKAPPGVYFYAERGGINYETGCRLMIHRVRKCI